MKTITVITHSLLAVFAVTLVAGCSPKSASMTITQDEPVVIPQSQQKPVYEQPKVPVFDNIPEQTFDFAEFDGGARQLTKPEVDILFIIDNSDSMRSAQANLARNIHNFSNEFTKNKVIDYHIGVTSIWDYAKRFTEHRPDSYGIGELRIVKDNGTNQPQRFVTRAEAPLLAKTLMIGVQSYADGGPETEEFFGPLVAALDKTGHGAPNEGFFRPEAQLVVIFMTDADEQKEEIDPESGVHRLSVQQMYQKLVDFKNGDPSKVSVYGVLVPQNAPDSLKDYGLRMEPKDHPECYDMTLKVPKFTGTCPKSLGPEKLESFVMLANGAAGTPSEIRRTFIKNITAPDFSKDLTEIGKGITKKTLAKVIYLNVRPRMDKAGLPQIKVSYGTPEEIAADTAQVIPYDKNKGWSFDPRKNAVVLSENIQYEDKDNAHYSLKLVVAPR